MDLQRTRVRKILTRTSGFLTSVTSHSLQPYQGCTFGKALCGQACYVQHNVYLTRGRPWGSFLEVRENAAESYRECRDAEARWARRVRGAFTIFMSSSTDPFLPQERRLGLSRSVLEAMREAPPDGLVLQTHSPMVAEHADLLLQIPCDLRVHLSVESDRDRLPGLPPPAASVEARLEAARRLRSRGLRVVITVSPLLPIAEPDRFFARVAECADAVVLDHFIGGDGSPDGRRTRATAVPAAMEAVEPGSSDLAYRDRMAAVARRHLPVGLSIDGFAGRFLG